jgi:hypothetical protein
MSPACLGSISAGAVQPTTRGDRARAKPDQGRRRPQPSGDFVIRMTVKLVSLRRQPAAARSAPASIGGRLVVTRSEIL